MRVDAAEDVLATSGDAARADRQLTTDLFVSSASTKRTWQVCTLHPRFTRSTRNQYTLRPHSTTHTISPATLAAILNSLPTQSRINPLSHINSIHTLNTLNLEHVFSNMNPAP